MNLLNTGRDGVKIACYQWLPGPDEPKFVVYISHGYADYACAYYNVVERILSIGGAVYAHDHYAHGKSGPFEVSHKQRCQLNKSVFSKLGFFFQLQCKLWNGQTRLVAADWRGEEEVSGVEVVFVWSFNGWLDFMHVGHKGMSVKLCCLRIVECHGWMSHWPT